MMSIREMWENEAIRKKAHETAANLLNSGVDEGVIKSSTGLSDDDFEEVRKEASSSSEAS